MDVLTQLVQLLEARHFKLVTAESCTGGGVAYHLTDIPGSSNWFECAYVTYTNHAKQNMLGVNADTLSKHGAVSEATVREMASGALSHSAADVSLAISGIAGPEGGTPDKPVGTVWFAWAGPFGVSAKEQLFAGDRVYVRQQAIDYALSELIDILKAK